MLELGALIVSGILNILLGFVVYFKNPKSATNRLFIMLTGSFVLWSVVNYISLHPFLWSRITWIRLVMSCAALLCLSVFLTFTTFPSSTLGSSLRRRRIAWVYTIFVMALALTPAVFKELTSANGSDQLHPGPGIAFFLVLVISLLGGGIWALFSKYRHSRGREKAQLRIVVSGLAVSFGLIFLTHFVLVVVFKNLSLIPLGPVYMLIFSSALAYAIIKHRLFDIRLVIVRAVAYLLFVTVFVLAFTAATFLLSFFVLGNSTIDARQHFSYIALALLFTPAVYWLKRFFDKVTNRIFFRDSYDVQVFLNQLNKVLVSTIATEDLLSRSSRLINQTIKPEFCTFVVRPLNNQPQRSIGDKFGVEEDDTKLFRKATSGGTKMIVSEELTDEHAHLRSILQQKQIGIVVRLADTTHTNGKTFGYLIMGVKKSGNLYSKQDITTIETVGNELTIAIQNALRFEEIEAFNITLKKEVEHATRELRKTNQRLRILDQTKDDFISMASHQLRTPLTSVKGYVSMVLDGDGGKINETQRKLLTQSFLSSQRMVYLISDLLNVSRLKTGKFVIEPVETNLAQIIEEEVEQLVETVKSRELELNYHKPENFPLLMVDETKLRQVIMNFIDNAIYYTPAGGHIDVYLEEKGQSIEFRVVDDGIGVPKHEQHHLFSKFYRAKNAKSARPDGTGLGIFMAKKVIIAQGGAIIFSSAEGKGSTFGFTFPKSRLMAKPETLTAAK